MPHFNLKDVETRYAEAVEYFLLSLPAPYKVSCFRVCFCFQILSSKCFCFHKNLTTSASTSLPYVLWKMLQAPQKVKCFWVCFHFQLLSSKCFHFQKNLNTSTASASTPLVETHLLAVNENIANGCNAKIKHQEDAFSNAWRRSLKWFFHYHNNSFCICSFHAKFSKCFLYLIPNYTFN